MHAKLRKRQYSKAKKQAVEAERNTYKANGPALQTQTQGDELTVSSSKVNFVFNKKSGLVTSYKVDGTEYFKDGFGIQPNFWRAPNDNDYGNGAPKRLHVWKKSSKDFHVTDTKVSTEDKAVLLQVTYLLAAGNLYVVTYKIYPSGIVHVNAKFTSTDMQAAETEVSEATRMATFLSATLPTLPGGWRADGGTCNVSVARRNRNNRGISLLLPLFL